MSAALLSVRAIRSSSKVLVVFSLRGDRLQFVHDRRSCYFGSFGPENRLRFSGRQGVFLSPLGIILPPHWVGVLGLSISSEAGIAMGRVLFHYSKQRHVVGQPDVAFLGLKSRI